MRSSTREMPRVEPSYTPRLSTHTLSERRAYAPDSERFQRGLSSVRTALVMTVMRLGLTRDLRKICQEYSGAMPRTTGSLAAAKARLTARWAKVSSPPGGPLSPIAGTTALFDRAPRDRTTAFMERMRKYGYDNACREG